MQILFYITLAVLCTYGILINYYFKGWLSIPKEVSESLSAAPTVTVIVPARNEAANIGKCLQALTSQIVRAQVIVVNDHSTDATANIVSAFKDQNVLLLHLKDYLVNPTNSFKKRAIEYAIEHATGDLIVCTDADCTAPPTWLRSMVIHYNRTQAAFIAAPVRMANDGSLLGIFQTLDFLPLQGITAAAVHLGIHSMSNGANLAYSRQVFHEVGGFRDIDQIASGDDMLLMRKIAKAFPGQISYLKSADAIVETQAEKSISDFFNQRIRWASKAGHYKDAKITLALLLVYLANIFLAVFMCFALVSTSWLSALVGLLLLKVLLEFPFVYSIARFYAQQRLIIYFPFIQPLHVFYTVIAGWLGIFGTYRWKNRSVR